MKITRSFSRKVQVQKYEPVDFYCSAEQEVDDKDMEEISQNLNAFCIDQVERDVQGYYAREPCKICGGLPSVRVIDGLIHREQFENGLCKNCRTQKEFQLKGLKQENEE